MGRKKLNLEAINDKKKRINTFHRRKECMIKKALELSTLCDVNVSMIISGADHQEPQIFPPDPLKLNASIELYKQHRSTNPMKIRRSGLSDFFSDRKKTIEGELAKAKKKTSEALYPTWFDFLNNSSEVQLRNFALGLENKMDLVRSRIEFFKKMQNLDRYPETLVDLQTSFVKPSINPYPIIPNLVFNPAQLHASDQKNQYFSLQPISPTSFCLPPEPEIPPLMQNNQYFSVQPISPTSFCLPPEPEIPPLMQNNEICTSHQFPSSSLPSLSDSWSDILKFLMDD